MASASASAQNDTLIVPNGTHNQGNPKLLCTPTQWNDIAAFFLANFVTHAATVKSVPGESAIASFWRVVFALLFPASGIITALSAIYHGAVFADTPLQTATRARALCMVVRTAEWKPRDGDVVECHGVWVTDKFRDAVKDKPGFESLQRVKTDVMNSWLVGIINFLNHGDTSGLKDIWKNSRHPTKEKHSAIPALELSKSDDGTMNSISPCFMPSKSVWDSDGRKVHGICRLPEGYALRIVSAEAQVLEIGEEEIESKSHDEFQEKTDVLEAQVKEIRKEQSADNNHDSNRGDTENCDNISTDIRTVHRDDESGKAQVETPSDVKKDLQTDQPNNLVGIFSSHSAPLSKAKQLWQLLQQGQFQQRQLHKLASRDRYTYRGEVSSNYNLIKSLVAIFQTLYASFTLYRARGDQIQRYGYAAFGLTVAPYLIMSVVNLVSNVLTPEYPTTYLVKTDIMDEASRREGAEFEGMVGSIPSIALNGRRKFTRDHNGHLLIESGGSFDSLELAEPPMAVTADDRWNIFKRPALIISSWSGSGSAQVRTKEILVRFSLFFASLIVTSLSIAINVALSHFEPGRSSHAQRVWTMTWLGFGILLGPMTLILRPRTSQKLAALILYGAPTIGGFVVVGQMLNEYGSCTRIS